MFVKLRWFGFFLLIIIVVHDDNSAVGITTDRILARWRYLHAFDLSHDEEKAC